MKVAASALLLNTMSLFTSEQSTAPRLDYSACSAISDLCADVTSIHISNVLMVCIHIVLIRRIFVSFSLVRVLRRSPPDVRTAVSVQRRSIPWKYTFYVIMRSRTHSRAISATGPATWRRTCSSIYGRNMVRILWNKLILKFCFKNENVSKIRHWKISRFS